MADSITNVVLKDSTLREGMDTPGVEFSTRARMEIARLLESAGVIEAEVVAPSRVADDLVIARTIKAQGIRLKTSGLIYANRPEYQQEITEAAECLDRFDLIMPLSEQRQPAEFEDKCQGLVTALDRCSEMGISAGIGFPHATQVDPGQLFEIAKRGAGRGASRITVYDTNGSAEPFSVRVMIDQLVALIGVPVFFHGHNDLGLAAANSWAAICGGASGLDVTINGLGDRAGNASLEQLVLLLHLQGIETGIEVSELRRASILVERLSGVAVSKLAPVVGDYIFDHRSPSHLGLPSEFEAFDPELVGRHRRTGGDSTH